MRATVALDDDLVQKAQELSGVHERSAQLREGLKARMHPFIAAEIALGSLHLRRERLSELESLFEVKVARLSEVRHMIESNELYSKGIGLTDAHLVAACLLTPGTQLWTRNDALEKVAKFMNIHFEMPVS
jgi:hypothetical protein